MKLRNLILSALMVSAGVTLNAQDSVLVQPQPSLPQGEYGTPKTGESGTDQKEDRVEVDKGMLPPKLQEALKEDKYAGWEKSPIYYEKNSDQYILNITKDNSTQTFRFDKKGQAITTDKPAEPSEKRQ